MSVALKIPLIKSGAVNPLASVPWVAQWKFNNNGNDSIGSNNLTNNNSATFTTGKLGGATGATLLASASLQYWSITDNAALSIGANSFLIAVWIYPTSFGKRIVGKDDAASNRDYYISSIGGNLVRFGVFNSSGTQYFLDSTDTITLNAWNLLVCWYNIDAQTIYININHGTTASAAAGANIKDSTAVVEIGAVSAAANYFDGRIDNVCIAKGAGSVPSQAVLDALWNGGNGTETLK